MDLSQILTGTVYDSNNENLILQEINFRAEKSDEKLRTIIIIKKDTYVVKITSKRS